MNGIEKHTIIQPVSFNLVDYKTNEKGDINSKKDAKKLLKDNVKRMAMLQSKLYAQDKHGILVIFQAMDTAGKDGAIRHVMSGLNPQGTHVQSFKVPSAEELDHDYLWRAAKNLPERGNIGIFNRSYYEEVLVVKVHNLLKYQKLPKKLITENIWEQRYQQINSFEKYLTENGFTILKFFLHISKEEQKNRLLARIDDPHKNWKFSEGDIKERGYWEQYQQCYSEAIAATATPNAPWHVIPSDHKWFARLLISEIICQRFESLNLEYPKLSPESLDGLEECRKQLMNESSDISVMV